MLVRRSPFTPFEVELVNGARFTAEHSEALVFNGGLVIYIGPQREFMFFDAEGVC